MIIKFYWGISYSITKGGRTFLGGINLRFSRVQGLISIETKKQFLKGVTELDTLMESFVQNFENEKKIN